MHPEFGDRSLVELRDFLPDFQLLLTAPELTQDRHTEEAAVRRLVWRGGSLHKKPASVSVSDIGQEVEYSLVRIVNQIIIAYSLSNYTHELRWIIPLLMKTFTNAGEKRKK